LLTLCIYLYLFFFSSRRRHTRSKRDWSSDVCSSDLRLMVSCNALFFLRHDPALLLRADADLYKRVSDILLPDIYAVVLRCEDRRSEERRVGKEWRSQMGTSDS